MVLIVEDEFDKKIGMFKDMLVNEKIGIKHASTQKEAREMFSMYYEEISTIILDCGIPKSETSINDDGINGGIPNGIAFLCSVRDEVYNGHITVIVNSNAEKDAIDDWLVRTGTKGIRMCICCDNQTIGKMAPMQEARINIVMDIIRTAEQYRQIVVAAGNTSRN